ncbi:hypothetical protein LSH36_110g01028 [Paralvinella palmiformis]|uniref:RING-type domain-containing protein n=1 Tax=Paralvinella palmiformis TaxID=53620 RepID=A0AAD9N971_9ANNE|nr:hypothetical protein LSH36_110g01028 [Paralvinella palmiformis]
MEGIDVREMSFQNVLDTILKPAGVKVGGFPQEMFQDLSEEQAEQFTCNICFLIVNECRQCDNRHFFCHTCSFAWTLTYGENSQKCPMCRCEQRDYKQNKDVDKVLLDKRVHCQEDGCHFKSPLKIFLMHSHGKVKYSNTHVDLESLRPARPQGARLLVLPSLGISGPGASRQLRGTVIRHQLHQGRVMIHQMMTLLHLEIQLRQQSFISYQSAMEPMARVQRLDEVLALNEQLNEIGTILSALLSTPLAGQSGQPQRTGSPETSASLASGSSARTLTRRVLSGMPPLTGDDDDDDDDDSDSSSDSSSSDSSLDLSSFGRRSSLLAGSGAYPPSSVLGRPPVSSLDRTLNEGQAALEQARERRQISQQILSENSAVSTEQTAPTDLILVGREPGMTPRISQLNRARERPRTITSPRGGDTSTMTSVLRLSTGNANHTNGANTNRSTSSNETEAISSSGNQLPSLAGPVASHSMQSTTDVLSTASSVPRRDQSRQDTPSPVSRTPTPTAIPQGSLALRQAMEAMFRSRTPSSIVSRLSGTASMMTTSSNSGTSQRGQQSHSHLDGSDVRPRSGAVSQAAAAAAESSSRAESSSSSAVDDRTRPEQNGTAATRGATGSTTPPNRTSPVQQGSILPASLYRRRQRTDSTLSGRSSNGESGHETASSSSQVSMHRSSSTGRGQNARPAQDPRSQSIGNRRRISVAAPPSNQKDQPRRSTITRRNALPNRPVVDRQTSTTTSSSHPNTDNAVSGLSSGRVPRRVSTLTSNRNRVAPARGTADGGQSSLPKLPGGHARPRRRSEIHQNLLMKK